jgi:hypothetical protein
MFKVNYSLEMQEVSTDFAIWHIPAYRDLDALASCCSEFAVESGALSSLAKAWVRDSTRGRCIAFFEAKDISISLYKA